MTILPTFATVHVYLAQRKMSLNSEPSSNLETSNEKFCRLHFLGSFLGIGCLQKKESCTLSPSL